MTDANEPINPVENTYKTTALGLTKREYFAAGNMRAILSKGFSQSCQNFDDAAQNAVTAADALIKALNESK